MLECHSYIFIIAKTAQNSDHNEKLLQLEPLKVDACFITYPFASVATGEVPCRRMMVALGCSPTVIRRNTFRAYRKVYRGHTSRHRSAHPAKRVRMVIAANDSSQSEFNIKTSGNEHSFSDFI